MRSINITTQVQVYEDLAELPAPDQILLQQAQKALQLTYAPYSKFQVGAAVRLANGEIILGGNQENAAYPMCLCAEQAALAAAHTQFPNIKIEAIAITVKNEKLQINQPAAPCGSCRQVIAETELRHQQDIAILLRGETGPIYKLVSGKALLPLGFDASFL